MVYVSEGAMTTSGVGTSNTTVANVYYLQNMGEFGRILHASNLDCMDSKAL